MIIIVLLLVAVVGYIRLYRHYRRNIKKVTFLFDAIDNGDFSFNFPTEKRFKEDNILHQSLNRIKLFLQHTREEQIDREKYYEQILNAVDTGILVVDSHDNILQHNQAALRLLDTDVLTHMNQVKGKLKDEHLAKHETQAMLKDKHVRIIALSDVSHELSDEDRQTVNRARRIQRFLAQPTHVAEKFTGIPGVYVPLKETLRGFAAIVDGEMDQYPEAAFYNVGTLDDVVAKAKKIEEGEV